MHICCPKPFYLLWCRVLMSTVIYFSTNSFHFFLPIRNLDASQKVVITRYTFPLHYLCYGIAPSVFWPSSVSLLYVPCFPAIFHLSASTHYSRVSSPTQLFTFFSIHYPLHLQFPSHLLIPYPLSSSDTFYFSKN